MHALAVVLCSKVWAMIVGSALLLTDRHYLLRHRPEAARRMWNHVTLALAISNMFVPMPLTIGAHVWVTRSRHFFVRILLALGAMLLSTALWMAAFATTCWLLGITDEGGMYP